MRKAIIPVALTVLLAAIVLLGAGLLRWERQVLAPLLGVLKVEHVFDRWTGQRWQTAYTLTGTETRLQIPEEALEARTAMVLGTSEYRREQEEALERRQKAVQAQEAVKEQVQTYYQLVKEVRKSLSGLTPYRWIPPDGCWGLHGFSPPKPPQYDDAILAAIPSAIIEAHTSSWWAVEAETAADKELGAIQSRAEGQARQELTAEASLRGRILTVLWGVLALGFLVSAIALGGYVLCLRRRAA